MGWETSSRSPETVIPMRSMPSRPRSVCSASTTEVTLKVVPAYELHV